MKLRKLILMRGHQGTGKSTILKEIGLEYHTLSTDSLRKALFGAEMTAAGNMSLANNDGANAFVFQVLRQQADYRMQNGETLAIDSTLRDVRDIGEWVALARRHGYELCIIDTSAVSLEQAKQFNARRPEELFVNPASIDRFYAAIQANPTPDSADYTVLRLSDDRQALITAARNWLNLTPPAVDLSSYARVVNVGDLQGCLDVLTESALGGKGLDPATFYVFIGDLIDRGPQSGEVVRWYLDHAYGCPNVCLLWGNHEANLLAYGEQREAQVSDYDFREYTVPQLIQAGVKRQEALDLARSARGFFFYTFDGVPVFANHAGLPVIPGKPGLISMSQYAYGTGNWTDDIDARYQPGQYQGQPVYQVHGHRNAHHRGVRAGEYCFNLEDNVEFGGALRTCTLSRNHHGQPEWSVAEYRNPTFRNFAAYAKLNKDHNSMLSKQILPKMPHWVGAEDAGEPVMSVSTYAQMTSHSGIRLKTTESYPHVQALNFTKDVFYDKSWDEVNVKARGLFVNPETLEIVARGYEKFWNVGERPETSLEALEATTQGPYSLFVKENGYLGNIGYDRVTNDLFFASKSTPEGDFAGWLREIFDETVDAAGRERLRRFLLQTNSSITLEVNDPVNDPHMIEYDQRELILLDIVHRSENFEVADHSVVEALGKAVGLKVKQPGPSFRTFPQLKAFLQAADNVAFKFRGKHLEGFVISDANGYMTKVKLPYYAFWKQMRSMKDRYLRTLTKGGNFQYQHTTRADRHTPASPEEIEMAHSFLDWVREQSPEMLSADIITLRKAFGRDFGVDARPTEDHPPSSPRF